MTDEQPRPRTFTALLRAGLPTRPGDWLAIALAALALRFFLGLSLTATFMTMVIAVPACTVAFAAARYAMGRLSPAPPPGDDDGR